MREGISLQTRRELLQHMLPQYREASTVKKKSKLLDAFTAATGYNRKYAMGLLNHAKVEQSTPQRPRPRHYGPEVQHALFLVWHAANRICAKRLIPFLPTLVEALERHEHLHLTEECRSQLPRSGRRPDLAFWRRIWWPIVAPTLRAATCTL